MNRVSVGGKIDDLPQFGVALVRYLRNIVRQSVYRDWGEIVPDRPVLALAVPLGVVHQDLEWLVLHAHHLVQCQLSDLRDSCGHIGGYCSSNRVYQSNQRMPGI